MQRVNAENERIKRQYFHRLKDAEGYSVATIDGASKAIALFEESSGFIDFKCFNHRRAVAFKKFLDQRKFRGVPIAARTKYSYLRIVKSFFTWLSDKQGFRRSISLDDVAYLTLDKKSAREALEPPSRVYPSLDHVLKLSDSISISTEIDLRDRALIAFTLLSGMRDKAIATLPFGSLDLRGLRVNQSPRLGVQTKFSKANRSTLFVFDPRLLEYIREWVKYLTTQKLFSSSDPLFPRTKVAPDATSSCFSAREVEPAYWKTTGSIRSIFKDRSKAADLRYYSPHCFRHTAVSLARKACRTAEELKAVSQNLGHEYVGTTMMDYAEIESDRVAEIVSSLDLNRKNEKLSNEEKEKLIRRLVNS